MKRIIALAVFIMMIQYGFSQKKNGTVYIEHSSIETSKQVWATIVAGDQKAYGNLFSDSAVVIYNGERPVQKIEDNIAGMQWWSKDISNLEISDNAPAFPDAIEYKNSGVWVQDWLLITGIHKKSGIRINLPIHNLYSFNEDGKITSMHSYFNNDVFTDIRNSNTIRENGKVFINHPYIASVRKLMNAYCEKDLKAMDEIYAENASFHNSKLPLNERIDWETQRALWAEDFTKYENIDMKEIGYPDCIFYELGNQYVVMSWWEFSASEIETGKKLKYGIMVSNTFNDEGKVVDDTTYLMSSKE